jgi:hypothetical protein
LACEGESIKAHKLVLSACSQYLKRLLKVWYYCQYQFLCIYGQFIGINVIKLHCEKFEVWCIWQHEFNIGCMYLGVSTLRTILFNWDTV